MPCPDVLRMATGQDVMGAACLAAHFDVHSPASRCADLRVRVQAVERRCWPRPLPTSARPTSLASRAPSCSPCGLVRLPVASCKLAVPDQDDAQELLRKGSSILPISSSRFAGLYSSAQACLAHAISPSAAGLLMLAAAGTPCTVCRTVFLHLSICSSQRCALSAASLSPPAALLSCHAVRSGQLLASDPVMAG